LQEGLTACRHSPIPRAGPSRILGNHPVGPGWYVLRLAEPAIAEAAAPGQFVQILCRPEGSSDPLLRRPFSIYKADRSAGTFDILYTVAGRGTRWMASLPREPAPGAIGTLDVIGPFGNTFTMPNAGDRVILVGGGVGVAPLYFLALQILAAARSPEIILCMGARTAAQLQGLQEFRALPIRCEAATDDGSTGSRGFVTGLLEQILVAGGTAAAPARIYGCGPSGMNEALRRIAVARGLWCEICLESRMACGFGICFGCVEPIRKEPGGPVYNRRVCWEGPVFDASLIQGKTA